MLNDSFKKRYGEIPLAYYMIQPAKKFYEKSQMAILHFHKEIEIIHITEGNAEIFIDGKKYCACAGDTVFVSPMAAHRMDVMPGMFSYYCICFEGELLGNRGEAESVATGRKKLPPIITNVQVGKSVKNIVTLFTGNDRGRSYSAIGELYKILGEIITADLLEDVSGAKGNTVVIDVFDYIQKNYTRQITSGDCAGCSYTDQSSFCRKFRKSFGMTFSQYLCLYRLERAKQLLEDGKLNVTEVGSAVGFAGTSYFIKKYKQTYGITPKRTAKQKDADD